jgi:hypothetical protein
MITVWDNVWSKYLARAGDIQSAEVFLMFCAIMRQIFRDFQKVRQYVAAAIQQGWMGITWWYVLQTHRKMDEFLQVGFKQHKNITHVFTIHLDRHHDSKTSFATLETTARKVETDMAAMQTSVN